MYLRDPLTIDLHLRLAIEQTDNEEQYPDVVRKAFGNRQSDLPYVKGEIVSAACSVDACAILISTITLRRRSPTSPGKSGRNCRSGFRNTTI